MRHRHVHRSCSGPCVWALLLGLVSLPVAAAPARLRVTVTRGDVVETRVVERTARLDGNAADFAEEVSLSGDGWAFKGVVAGLEGPDDTAAIVPRGGSIMFTAKVGLAAGFVNNEDEDLEVEFEVCVEPFAVGAVVLYGGSIAGSLLDADGDGTGGLRSNSMEDPIYELRVATATCADVDPGSVNTVATLYDFPQGFGVPGVYQGLNLAEQFFGGDPIPLGIGPLTSTSFEMLVRYQVTPGEFVGFTSVGVLRGEVPAQAESAVASDAPPPPAPALVPRGVPPPSPSLGPLYSLGFAVGERPNPPPETFNFNVEALVSPPIASPSRHGGIILGTMTDFSGTTCTAQTDNGLPFYRASADGAELFSLYDDPTFFIANNYHSTLIPPQSFGAQIPSAAGPAIDDMIRLDLDFELLNQCLVTFLAIYVVPACAEPSYDVDGDGSVGALTDGLLILRYLFGFSGSTLVTGALGAGATRTDPAAIAAFLGCLLGTMLDVDDNGSVGALTDGLLILRHLFGFSGATLTTGALGAGAMRTDPAALAAFMNQFIP